VAITSDVLGTPLDPGAYRVADPFGHAFSISMPAGWSVQSLAAGQVKLGGAGRDLEFYVVHDVPADPCHPGPSDPSATPPPAGQLVTSLSSLTGFQSGPITSVAVGNRRASRFVISNAIDTSTAGCDGDKLLPLFTPVGGEPASTNGGTVQQLWVVDTGTVPVLIVGDGTDGMPSDVQSEVDSILASIAFD
jgi:hypothetical protein